MNKKERRAALKSALTSKVQDNKLVVVDALKMCIRDSISASDPADNKRSFQVTVRQSVIVKHRTDISVICIMAEI